MSPSRSELQEVMTHTWTYTLFHQFGKDILKLGYSLSCSSNPQPMELFCPKPSPIFYKLEPVSISVERKTRMSPHKKVEIIPSAAPNPCNVVIRWQFKSNPRPSLPNPKEESFLQFRPIWRYCSKRHYNSPNMSCINIRYRFWSKADGNFWWKFIISLSVQTLYVWTSLTQRMLQIKVFVQEISVNGFPTDVVNPADDKNQCHSSHTQVLSGVFVVECMCFIWI